jgi:hypothetical protein
VIETGDPMTTHFLVGNFYLEMWKSFVRELISLFSIWCVIGKSLFFSMIIDFVINRVASNGDINEEVFYIKCDKFVVFV